MDDFQVEDAHDWTTPSDFPIGQREFEMPGGREIAQELDEYLDAKGIRHLFVELAEMLLHTTPVNPIQAIISHFHQNYPDLCENPTYLAAAAFGDECIRPKIFDSDFDESSEDDVDAKPTERVLTPGGDGPKSAAAVLKRRGAVSSGSTPQVDSFTLELPSVRKGDGDRARLKETLVNGTRLFPLVPEEVLNASVDALSMIVVRSGEVLARAGTMGDKLYIIDSGECQLVEKVRDDSAKKKVDRAVQERIVESYKPGMCVGETSLLHAHPWTADFRTNGVTRLWVLDRASYQSIGYKFSDIRWLKRRAAADQFGLLKDMVEDERVRLSNMLELVQFNDKDVIFRQFDPAEDCFLIDQGRVNLVEQLLPSSPYTEIARLDAGMVFGESALLAQRPRTVSAVAVGTVKCYKIRHDTFERVVGSAVEIIARDPEAFNTYKAMKV